MPVRVLREWAEFSTIEPWGAPWQDFLSARSDFRYAVSVVSEKQQHKLHFPAYLYSPFDSDKHSPERRKQRQLLGFVDFLKDRKRPASASPRKR